LNLFAAKPVRLASSDAKVTTIWHYKLYY